MAIALRADFDVAMVRVADERLKDGTAGAAAVWRWRRFTKALRALMRPRLAA